MNELALVALVRWEVVTVLVGTRIIEEDATLRFSCNHIAKP